MIKVNKIFGSPYDVAECMKVVVNKAVPIKGVDYGDIGDEYEGNPFKLFTITVDAEFSNDAFVRVAEALRRLAFDAMIEPVYIEVNDGTVIDVRGDADIEYGNILD